MHMTHGLCNVRMSYSLYTDCADGTELFRNFTEATVLSVCSVYKNRNSVKQLCNSHGI
jgi:hypothetical protein